MQNTLPNYNFWNRLKFSIIPLKSVEILSRNGSERYQTKEIFFLTAN